MEKIYLVSVQPDNGQSMPKIYFAESYLEVEEFEKHYDHGSVAIKSITKLPDFTDDDEN